ncbi:protein kinase [Streptomyces sp. XD-27]|uniref:protein kinase n=1 Tax=Streptomyces sp. XD-27 TaxID=3062779 RepID=UPI0026F4389D|nr:protein kinase [Streptomyces sp. XD-27]WKX72072.1 protein kinase [Streptomyces sp. XD-27]
MDDYAGRILADRYRLPLPPSDAHEPHEPAETRAFDTYSGQEVLVRQIPLPEVVEAEVVGDPGERPGGGRSPRTVRAARGSDDPLVRRAIDAATAAAAIPDHPRLDQVFHVFAEAGSLWIVSEFVAGRPLAALLAGRPLSPHRAAEIAADVLTALRALHAHGWIHRNITARTVLICDDGRAMLTGLAAGAAQEALCGYDPRPAEPLQPLSPPSPTRPQPAAGAGSAGRAGVVGAAGAARGPLYRDQGPAGGVPAPRESHETRHSHAARDAAIGPGAGADAAIGAGAGLGAGPGGARGPADGGHAVPGGRAGQEGVSQGPADGPGAERAAARAAERAREARIVVIGAVTERWAPEQAGTPYPDGAPVSPVGPAADLWAVGALLFRAVQGHAPYPEENAAELVRLVGSRAPAYADECGVLRPVVESLMRRNPAERPDFESLRGWLRGVIRTAPEPDVGSRTVVVPASGASGPSDPARLPVVRRRGWLVRRGRGRGRGWGRSRGSAVPVGPHGRHKRARPPRDERAHDATRAHREPREARMARGPREPRMTHGPREPRLGRERGPRNLGRVLLLAILLLLVAGLAFAMLFMPKAEQDEGRRDTGPAGASASTSAKGDGSTKDEGRAASGGGANGEGAATSPQSTQRADLAEGFAVRKDPAGFQVAVHETWQRRPENQRGQIRYVRGAFELIVVPGRDAAAEFGADPMAYQQSHEPELAAYRAASWASASGLRRTDVGETAMAEGEFRWRDGGGREVCARNAAMLLNGRYHVVQVIGPSDEHRAVARFAEQAAATYAATTAD